MENYVLITWLNDFIFCPYSIYLHNVYNYFEQDNYYTTKQTAGAHAHKSIDTNTYNTHKDDIVGLSVYSAEFELCGKIDILHKKNKLLVERKRKIVTIYDGYLLQLYAQYYCLTEMGYQIEKLALHSLVDNKRYYVDMPDYIWHNKLENILNAIKTYDPDKTKFRVNSNKCNCCIYNSLCDKAILD
jgi:CRISPR-associated protein Cas4